ncbi:protein TIC 21, chloroplastic-like isoform X1 [Panicum miliaceum]|uniref:Protein TIC 21, chloroplastic-like isoform X1 n=1 Tax=Panicum miliaceum TaxID=4540 RepID=A0A3L6PEI4_PANMI|nr:protein TIC 21, chloroplastic-like isoform X1 [Panicum miliaceum]
MWSLLLSPAPPRPPLPTLRWRPVSSPAPKPSFSAPSRGAATVGTGTSSYAAGRSSLPRHLAAAAASGPSEPTPLSAEDGAERAMLAKDASSNQMPKCVLQAGVKDEVSKKLEKTARYFKNLGNLGFWSQLVCTTVSAGILTLSAVATGDATAPFTFCATSLGIIAAFISVFRSFGYIRLSERLRRTANEPAKAPARAAVVNNLRNSIVFNVVGIGAAVLGLQATVGALLAKALTASSVPYYQGIPPGQSPVLALDIFLVQASANTILSHFLGLSSSLELLRSVTEAAPVPKPA